MDSLVIYACRAMVFVMRVSGCMGPKDFIIPKGLVLGL